MTNNIINKTIARFGINNFVRNWTGKNQDFVNHLYGDLDDKTAIKTKEMMSSCLSSKSGESSIRDSIVDLTNIYTNLSDVGKLKFLLILSEEFESDYQLINKNISNYLNTQESESLFFAKNTLLRSLESPRSKMLKHFCLLQNGIKFLVDMREDVKRFKTEHKPLMSLEYDLYNILVSWFDLGLLDLKRITWNSSASLLEKLIYYEAVHKIKSWDDLRNRLDSDRLCFAVFHYKMPNEPLIFVEVALTNGVAQNIHDLLDEEAPAVDAKSADTAVFYSISNTQRGLQGISFGNFLIKSAVSEISNQYRNISNFITLSPIPGFCNWLKNQMLNESIIESDMSTKMIYDVLNAHNNMEVMTNLEKVDWHTENQLNNLLKDSLMKLCAGYLINHQKKGIATDPVAHFHLSNGASIISINWLADNSIKGIKQSFGMMVNYCYDLDKIDENQDSYMTRSDIKYSKEVRNILGKQIKYK